MYLYRGKLRFNYVISPSLETTVTRLKIGERSYFDLIFPLRPMGENGTPDKREREARSEGEKERKGKYHAREGREKQREGVRNDYLSFKTNSQVSAKSSANQRVEGEGLKQGERREVAEDNMLMPRRRLHGNLRGSMCSTRFVRGIRYYNVFYTSSRRLDPRKFRETRADDLNEIKLPNIRHSYQTQLYRTV